MWKLLQLFGKLRIQHWPVWLYNVLQMALARQNNRREASGNEQQGDACGDGGMLRMKEVESFLIENRNCSIYYQTTHKKKLERTKTSKGSDHIKSKRVFVMSEISLMIIVVWFILTLLVLRWTPNNKIREIGNFFKQILSVIPLSKFFDLFK